MTTVDEVIERGRYRDRRGRIWGRVESPAGSFRWITIALTEPDWNRPELRFMLFLKRDLHRDECPGLRACEDHPVAHVFKIRSWDAFPPLGGLGKGYRTHAEALAAAQRLAKERDQ